MTRDPGLDRWREEVRRALPHADRDLVEEIAVHVADRWAASQAAGGTLGASDAAARAEIDAWRTRRSRSAAGDRRSLLRWAAGLTLDLAEARRRMRVAPLASAGAMLLIALATAAAVAVFVLARDIRWRPLPYPDAPRLVALWQLTKGETTQISYPDYDDLRRTGAFDAAAALSAGVGTLTSADANLAERVHVVEAEPALLAMIGATPALGRLLADDDGGKLAAVISHRLWQSQFHGETAVVGRTFGLSGRTFTVVGVLGPDVDFELPIPGGFNLPRADVWIALDRAFPFVTRRDVSGYEAIARLAPGVTLGEARTRAAATAEILARDFAATNRDREFRVEPLQDWITGRVVRPLQLASAAAAIVALIALANLITLALGRLSARHTDRAVRASLGASRWRLARQVLVGEAPTAFAGGLLGLVAGLGIARALAASPAASLPRAGALTVDSRVFVFAWGIVMIFWIVPIAIALWLQRAPAALHGDARVVGRATRRARRLLVAGEIALALVLVTAAAVLSLTIARLLMLDPGFSTSRTLTLRLSAYATNYPTRESVAGVFARVASALESQPGIEHAAASSSLPLSGSATGTSLMAERDPRPPALRLSAGWQFVTPGYFRAAGIPLISGRDFDVVDVSRAPHVTVLNRAAARALFGDADPIGQRVAVGGDDANGDWHTVIGIVGDVRHQSLTDDPDPRVYDLLGQHWGRTMYVVVRTSPGVDAASLAPAVRRVVAGLDRDMPIFEVATVEALVNRSIAPRRLAAILSGGLAVVSMLLALVGTIAVVSCTVVERTREMGVRLALGATRGQVLALVLRDAGTTAMAGAAAGAIGGLLAVRALAGQLFGVQIADALVLVPALAVLLALASLAAAWWPARRATQADPLRALHAIGE